ncbi:MAG: ABC transporter substrate-binding protein, partial [Magnetococcales bacterium]|nr:ABC transporter substrate-binding protein [Magnetococcales bacterium]
MMRKLFLLILPIVLLTLAVMALVVKLQPENQTVTLTVGLAAPLSGPFQAVGESMRRGAALAVKETNERLELGRFRLRLESADDRSGLKVKNAAIESAHKLVSIDSLIGVVGHYFSTPTMDTSRIYQRRQVPVITPTATNPKVTAGSDWSFSMIPDDFHQAIFLANYVIHGLNRRKIGIIYSKNPYGQSLAGYFGKELEIRGVTPTLRHQIDHISYSPDALAPAYEAIRESEIIFLAMNYKTAAKVIKQLKHEGIKSEFIGAESMGGPHFIREAGIDADNVYAVAPYLPNLFGELSERYRTNFIRTYQRRPDWVATNSYEAVKVLVHAIKKVGPDPVAIRNYLRKTTQEVDAIPGVAGDIYFNPYGASRRPVAIGQVKEGRFLPARFQLTYVKYPELAKARRHKSPIVKIDGRYAKRTTVVFTGIHVNDVRAFDPIESHFEADFLLWFRWDPDQNKKLNFEMTHGEVLNAKIREKYFDKKTRNNFIAYSVSARMEGVFPLHDFPFDQQILKIR